MAKARKQDKGTCSMNGCTEPAKWTGLCSACYAWLHYWQKKTPGQVMRRIAAVEKAERRLETIAPTQVHRLSQRRKRA